MIPKDPIAAAAGTFMLGTKGEVTAAAVDRHRGEVLRRSLPNPLMARLAEVRKSGDVAKIAEAIPYAPLDAHRAGERHRQVADPHALSRRHFLGNTFLPAIHGGTLGAMLEMAAIFHLLWETETETVPKIVNITVDYLRSARPVDVIACAKVTKQGRRMVNVYAEAWQDDRAKPVATANAHFLIKSDDAPPSL